LKQDLESLSGQNVTVVTTARLGEWNERLARYLAAITRPVLFQRFTKIDYGPLIDRLVKYVPSPKFRRMTTGTACGTLTIK
jgi:hypothetical protein